MGFFGTWRVDRELATRHDVKYDPYPATRFFDNMAFIGDKSVCCYILSTSEGLILIDCMYRRPAYLEMIKRELVIWDLNYPT